MPDPRPKWATVAWAKAYLRQPADHQLLWENRLAREVLAEERPE